MSLRKIVVVSTTKSTPRDIQSEATTWGQLKDALRGEYGDLEGMRAVVRETRGDLAANDALLPSTDFTLFLTPTKIKAGVSEVKLVQVLESLKEKFNDAIDELIDEVEDGDHDETSYGPAVSKATNSAGSLFAELREVMG